MELFLGIGLIRNEEYVGLYLNLTAWNREDYEPTNIIELTLRKGSKIEMKIEKVLVMYIVSRVTESVSVWNRISAERMKMEL